MLVFVTQATCKSGGRPEASPLFYWNNYLF